MIEQPANLGVNLFVHQLASVHRMEQMEREKFVLDARNDKIYTDIGINADITGYGKTISMVTLVLRDKMEWNTETDYEFQIVESCASHHIKKIHTLKMPKNNTTLVLCSPSIVHQWMDEFSKTDLNVVKVVTRNSAMYVDIDDYDVVIVTPTYFNFLIDRHDSAWKRFIYDEPSSVRVPSMRPIRCGFMWLVSATPDDIYRRHRSCTRSYISSIVSDRTFNLVMRPYLTVKNNDHFIRQSFQMPPTKYVIHNCRDSIYRAVYGIVHDRISKMIEAGHISGAVQALGGKKTDNIIELVKKNKLIELEEIQTKIKIWTLRNDEEKIKEWTDKEKSVLTQIKDLESRFNHILSQDCSICYDKINKPIMEPSCQNIFCGTCLLTWLKDKGNCPLCRRVIKKEELVYINEGEEKCEEIKKEEEEEEIKSKEDTIIDIIKNKKDGRFIIFSQWDDSFEKIRLALRTSHIDFVEIKGSIQTRENRLDEFRSGQVNVAFLNSGTDSSGINMQQTTDIILYHSMDELTRQQIIGRANRIGRTQPLFIHNLLSV